MDETERVEVSALVVAYRDIAPTGEMQAAAYVIHAEEAVRHFWRYRPPLEDEPHYSPTKFRGPPASAAQSRGSGAHDRAGRQDRRQICRV